MADRRRWLCAFLRTVTLLLLACFPHCHGQDPVTLVVGDEGTWWTSPAASGLPQAYYQEWSDRQTVHVNDSLYFSYNNSLYDVTVVPTQKAFSACDASVSTLNEATGQSYLTFYLPSTYYVLSSGTASSTNGDCKDGMKFSVAVLSAETALAPPPLQSDPPSPPPSANPTPPTKDASPPPQEGPPPEAPGSPPQGSPPQGSPPQGSPPQGSPPQGSPPQAEPPPASNSPPNSPPPPSSSKSPPSPSSSAPKGGFVIQIEIPWEPQVNNSDYYQTYLQEQLQKNGLSFVSAGASLVFKYKSGKHNVLRVNETQFKDCTIPQRPLSLNKDPDIPVTLPDEGDYYFIDGLKDYCAVGNMKLFVQVGPASPPGPSTPASGSSSGSKFPIEAAVALPVLVVVGLVIGFCCCKCYRARATGKYTEVSNNPSYVPPGLTKAPQSVERMNNLLAGKNGRSVCKVFTFEELERATDRFSPKNEIGSGGFGTVYKGTLDDGTVVAIKRTKHAGGNDVDQFVNEVAILSQVNNRNLVKLLGCCVVLEVPLLVYEFISNGTLQDHLAMAEKGHSAKLTWSTRFKIAIQTAEALKYLHVQATPPIFHRDVKSANILLDESFNAKVADFGLSKLVDLEATHVSTVVKGTPGYLDPEYFHNFQLTDKTDVYSYGVVLLELITSRKPIDMARPGGEQNLSVCSIPLIRTGRVGDIIDELLASQISEEEFDEIDAVAQVAVACLIPDRATRPSMSEVVEMLQRIKGSKLNAEEFLGRADANEKAQIALNMQDLANLSRGYNGYDSYNSKANGGSSSSSISSGVSAGNSAQMRPR